MSTGSIIIAVSILIVALAFVALVIFLAITLLSLRRTISDVDNKIQAFDPLFRIVSKTGEVVEQKAKRSLEHVEERECALREEIADRNDRMLNIALDVAQWGLIGVALWQKIRERK